MEQRGGILVQPGPGLSQTLLSEPYGTRGSKTGETASLPGLWRTARGSIGTVQAAVSKLMEFWSPSLQAALFYLGQGWGWQDKATCLPSLLHGQ